jgi:hypothetical protein
VIVPDIEECRELLERDFVELARLVERDWGVLLVSGTGRGICRVGEEVRSTTLWVGSSECFRLGDIW